MKIVHKSMLGIMGHPVAHSLSPLMHNRASEILKLPYTYSAFDISPENVEQAIESFRLLGVKGINVTVPHKEKVVPFLDALDDDAGLIGAVNTIYWKDGNLTGGNTDGKGFMRSLKASGFKPRRKKVAMIGAGGSSRAIAVLLVNAGISQLTIINRGSANSERLVKFLVGLAPSCSFHIRYPDSEDIKDVIGDSDLVVQTTPVGMKRSDPLPLSGAVFRKGQYVYDIIYSPFETKLLKSAKGKGAKTLNGLGMLLYQGSESFRIWTGKRFPEEKIFRELKRFLSRGR